MSFCLFGQRGMRLHVCYSCYKSHSEATLYLKSHCPRLQHKTCGEVCKTLVDRCKDVNERQIYLRNVIHN